MRSFGFRQRGRVVFSAAIDGAVYAKHGTTIDTRLTVIDKLPADDTSANSQRRRGWRQMSRHAAGLGAQSTSLRGCRSRCKPLGVPGVFLSCRRTWASRGTPGTPVLRFRPLHSRAGVQIELAYETLDWKPTEGGSITEALYEEYGLQTIRISDSQAHPTKLVQSVAMASVAPPKPSYRPHLPPAGPFRRAPVGRPA